MEAAPPASMSMCVPVRRLVVWVAGAAMLSVATPASAREAGDPIRLKWTEGGVAGRTPIWAAGRRARDDGDPIRLKWTEGDVAGMTPIWSADGHNTIGFVEYHQRRNGDRLETVRRARFSDRARD